MTEYEKDMKDIEFFSAWLKDKFGDSTSKVAIRDYSQGKLLSLEFDSENNPKYTAFDDKYNRMFDLAISVTDSNRDYFEMQKDFLKWGFFLIAKEENKLYFEKLDDFKYNGKVFSSCSEFLTEYGINVEEFYSSYKSDRPILDYAFELVDALKPGKVDIDGSTVFQDKIIH